MKRIALLAASLLGAALAPAQAQTSPSAYTSAIRYDVMGRTTGTIAPDPDGAGPLGYAATRTTYDAAGRPIKIETGQLANWQSEAIEPQSWTGFTMLSQVETTYDASDRKLQELTKGSDMVPVSLVQYSYDVAGRLECTARRMNPAVYGSLPSSACSLGTEGSFGPDRITKSIYDAAGQVTKVQQAYATPLQEDYATYTYNANGKRTSLTDAKGYLATMTYDGQDRQARWYFPSPTTTGVASTTDYEEYGYDANGNRTSLRKRDGSTLTYQYDALNRNTLKIVPERSGLSPTHTRDVYYGYDYRGLQTYAHFDGLYGEGVNMAYDGFGRLVVSNLWMDGVSRSLYYTWDKNGNRIRLSHPDGYESNVAYDGLDREIEIKEFTTAVLRGTTYNNRGLVNSETAMFSVPLSQYGYEPSGRVSSLSYDMAGSGQDVTFGYGYTPVNQLAQQSRDNDAFAWTEHYNVDRNYSVNGLNQYTAAGPASLAYDANGNLTSDGSTALVYDVENRLVNASGAKTAALRYDPLGRLYEVVGASGTTRFLYDGDELVSEFDDAGAMLRRYVHGRGIDDPVMWYEMPLVWPNGYRRLVRDHQGSVIAAIDGTGSTIAINSYDEYGIPKAGNIGRFQYTGQAWIPELGIYYYKARMYSPTLGRFMQTDPIGYDDQVNLYAYVANDPVNRVDSAGTETGCITLNTGCGMNTSVSPQESEARETAFNVAMTAIPIERAIAGTVWVARYVEASKAARLMTESKVFGYLLSPLTRDGAPKAAWFDRALGFTQKNGADLARQLKFDPRTASLQKTTKYGTVYTQTSEVVGANGKKGVFTSVWQKDATGAAAGAPRLITAKDFKIVE